MKARFLPHLALAGVIGFASGCRLAIQSSVRSARTIRDSQTFGRGRHGPLTKEEQAWAKVAWKYFQNNYQPATGLVSTVDKGTTASMWTAGDALAALDAAHRLKLVDDRETNQRLTALLSFLNRMPLAGEVLPNRRYRIDTGAPLDAKGQIGIEGWSAIDIGRLLLWLRLDRKLSPPMSEYFDKAVLRWNICRGLDDIGTLYRGSVQGNAIQTTQEGRLGYEEYAAEGFQSWGFSTAQASRLQPFSTTRILGVQISFDSRDARSDGVLAPVLSLPYFLYGLELDWNSIEPDRGADGGATYSEFAQNIYRVQEARYRLKGILTARTDHMVARAPFVVYDSIFAMGYPWNTVTDSGARDSADALVATQAVFPMRSLWKTRYTDTLTGAVKQLYDPDRGWYEGRSELTGGAETIITARTNVAVLESLAYQVDGRLYRDAGTDRFFRTEVSDPFGKTAPCISTEDPADRKVRLP